MNKEHKENATKTPIWRIVTSTSLMTGTLCLLLTWGAFQFFSAPMLLKYTGYADSYVLTKPDAFSDPVSLFELGELVTNGTILSIDDLWSFQSSFYQTIISVLIAINALLAVFAFIFIKNSSHDKAVDAAVSHTQKYISGIEFDEKVNANAQRTLGQMRDDYNETAATLERALDQVSGLSPSVIEHTEQLTMLSNNIKDMQQHVGILIQRVAQLDSSESEGQNIALTKERITDGVY